jgi:UPF0755 protein
VSRPPYDPTSVVDPRDRRAASYATSQDPDDFEWERVRRAASRQESAAERRRRRGRRAAVIGVLAAILVPFLLVAGWFYLQLEPRGGPGDPVTITIEEGAGTGQVASQLVSADVVDSSTAFKVWASLTGAGPYTPGDYQMHTNLGVRDAISVLKQGPPVTPSADLTLMLPPGLTLNQIADRVATLPGRNRDTFLQIVNSGVVRSKYMPAGLRSAEGFLFPDTYRVGETEDEGAIAQKLVRRFDEIADRVGLANATPTNGLSPYQTVVAASLIEKEAKLAEDAPLISAVIRNRLRDGMQLQIDATLCYAKGGCPPAPTNADKQIDSPYNTYRVSGLPPTPIASVTEANLRAAIHPADASFKFYVLSDANGKHAFANTLAEHDANVARARAKGLL